MRAQNVNESSPIFKPKKEEDIIEEYFGHFNDDFAIVIDDILSTLGEHISVKDNKEDIRKGMLKSFENTLDYYIDNIDLNESLGDVLKPKSMKDIVDELSRAQEVNEYILKDGRKAWVFEKYFKDYGGFLAMVDENGKKYLVDNDILNLFEMNDRIEIVEWLDNL